MGAETCCALIISSNRYFVGYPAKCMARQSPNVHMLPRKGGQTPMGELTGQLGLSVNPSTMPGLELQLVLRIQGFIKLRWI